MADKIDYQLALTRACIAYAEFTGSCPLEMHDVDMDCENSCQSTIETCDQIAAECWQKYFLSEGG